jgi:hypothetical protein
MLICLIIIDYANECLEVKIDNNTAQVPRELYWTVLSEKAQFLLN